MGGTAPTTARVAPTTQTITFEPEVVVGRVPVRQPQRPGNQAVAAEMFDDPLAGEDYLTPGELGLVATADGGLTVQPPPRRRAGPDPPPDAGLDPGVDRHPGTAPGTVPPGATAAAPTGQVTTPPPPGAATVDGQGPAPAADGQSPDAAAPIDVGTQGIDGGSPAVPPAVTTPEQYTAAATAGANGLHRPASGPNPAGRVFGAGRRRLTRRAATATDPSRRMPRPRPVDPVEIDPVPKATEAILAALNARLPDLALPTPMPLPSGVVPAVTINDQDRDALVASGQLKAEDSDELPNEPAVTQRAATDRQRRRTAADQAAAKAAEVTPIPRPLQPPVLVDIRPIPPRPPSKEELEQDRLLLTNLLSQLLAETAAEAKTVVDAARSAAYPDGMLTLTYPDKWADELTPPIETAWKAEFERIQKAAGIADDRLRAAIDQRRRTLVEQKKNRAKETADLVSSTVAVATAEAEQDTAKAEATKQRLEAQRVRRLQAALTSHDPALVEALVTERMGIIERDTSRAVLSHENGATRRKGMIDYFTKLYQDAYRAADEQAQTKTFSDGSHHAPMAADGRPWLDVANESLTTATTGLKTKTDADCKELVDDSRTAGLDARSALRDWAATRLKKERTEDERQQQRTADASAQVAADIQAGKDQEAAAARDALLQEVHFAAMAHQRLAMTEADEQKLHVDKLDADKRAFLENYLKVGDDPADPMSAVAVGVRAAFASKHVPELIQTFKNHVDKERPTEPNEMRKLALLLDFDADHFAHELHEAFEYTWGTDEDRAYTALENLDAQRSYLVEHLYADNYGEDLRTRIASEMGGNEKKRAMALLDNDKKAAASAMIAESNGFFVKDKQLALDAIRLLPPGQADELRRTHLAETGNTLDEDLTAVMAEVQWTKDGRAVQGHRGLDAANALLELNALKGDQQPGQPDTPKMMLLQAKADAIEYDMALRAPDGATDLDKMTKVYDRIRKRVTDDPAHQAWTQAQIEDEVRRRMQYVETQYGAYVGPKVGGKGGYESVLRKTMAEQLVGGDKFHAAMSQLEVDRVKQRAAGLSITTHGMYAADDEVNAAQQVIWDDALEQTKREQRDEIDRRVQASIDAANATKDPLSPAEVAAERRRITEALTEPVAKARYGEVKASFGALYANAWGGDKDKALETMLVDVTQWGGETEAMWRFQQGGRLSIAQNVRLSVKGWGMDDDQATSATKGRTKQELDDARTEYLGYTHGAETLDDRLMNEAEGRTKFDLTQNLKGPPHTDEEVLARMRERIDYERDTYFKGRPDERAAVVGGELHALEAQYAIAAERLEALKRARLAGDTAQVERLQASMFRSSENVFQLADDYRQTVDRYTERTVQIVGLVVAVVAGVVLDVVTLGAATPFELAVMASILGTAAAIATKQSILGDAYTSHELTKDLIIGAVDAVAAGYLSRLGDIMLSIPKLAKVSRSMVKAAKAELELLRKSHSAIKRFAVSLVENAAQASPSAVVGNVIERKNWRGDPVKNIVGGIGQQVGTGLALGTLMHGAQAATGKVVSAGKRGLGVLHSKVFGEPSLGLAEARPIAEVQSARQALETHGSPAERSAAFHQFQESYPTATIDDFAIAVADGHVKPALDANGTARFHEQARAELTGRLTPAERARFADVPIEVLSGAEFTARTGSLERGQAAVLIRDGTPVVVLREGAPLSALREEGIHLRQLADPANAAKLPLLDEARLANWKDLSLEERAASWQAKLDLEIDAQRQLMAELEAEAAAAATPRERQQLAAQLDRAKAAFEVLSGRRDQLGDLLTAGTDHSSSVTPPPFLDEPARLFAKKARGTMPEEVVALRREIARLRRLLGEWMGWQAEGKLSKASTRADSWLERLAERLRAGTVRPDDPEMLARLRAIAEPLNDVHDRLRSATTKVGNLLQRLRNWGARNRGNKDVTLLRKLLEGDARALLDDLESGRLHPDDPELTHRIEAISDPLDSYQGRLDKVGRRDLNDAIADVDRRIIEAGESRDSMEVTLTELRTGGADQAQIDALTTSIADRTAKLTELRNLKRDLRLAHQRLVADPKADARMTLAAVKEQLARMDRADETLHIPLTDATDKAMVINDFRRRTAPLLGYPGGEHLVNKMLELLATSDELVLGQSPRSSGKGAAATSTMQRRVLEALAAGKYPPEYAAEFYRAMSDDGWPRAPDGRAWEVDHVIELWAGGADDISNYMALDPRLHKLKSQILTDFRNQYRRGLKRLDADIESRDTDLPMLDLSDVPSQ